LQTQTITTGNHILGIYSNSEQELDECFTFLKAGFDNNEAIWIMEQDLTKDEIRKKIEKECDIQNIEELEAKGDIIITNSREWYYLDGKLYADRIKGKW
jgi:DcmR-like sensory protein